MINIELSSRDIASPGLYLMRWNGYTGLVRIVGQPKTGFTIISPENGRETYCKILPANRLIPDDALFSEPLNVSQT